MAFKDPPPDDPRFPPDRFVRRNPEPAPPPPAATPPPVNRPPNIPAGNPFKPQVRLAQTSDGRMPLGASHQPPVPAPLPERGAGLFFFINLAAAFIAVLFTFLIYLKL